MWLLINHAQSKHACTTKTCTQRNYEWSSKSVNNPRRRKRDEESCAGKLRQNSPLAGTCRESDFWLETLYMWWHMVRMRWLQDPTTTLLPTKAPIHLQTTCYLHSKAYFTISCRALHCVTSMVLCSAFKGCILWMWCNTRLCIILWNGPPQVCSFVPFCCITISYY